MQFGRVPSRFFSVKPRILVRDSVVYGRNFLGDYPRTSRCDSVVYHHDSLGANPRILPRNSVVYHRDSLGANPRILTFSAVIRWSNEGCHLFISASCVRFPACFMLVRTWRLCSSHGLRRPVWIRHQRVAARMRRRMRSWYLK